MNNFNEEQFEATQADTNKYLEEFIKTLSEEDRNKFKAVEQAVKILLDAKVMAYVFPLLPYGNDKNKETVWQWNTIMPLMKIEDGKIEEASLKKNSLYHRALIYHFYGKFLTSMVRPEGNVYLNFAAQTSFAIEQYSLHNEYLKN